MEVIKFDPTVEQLNAIVESVKLITAEDLSDDKQLEVVKETRLKLRSARTTIEKQGKEMRADAVKFSKDVITREKELIAIIEPEEIRLKALEDQANQIKVRTARAALLPMRIEQLTLLGITDINPEVILDLDNEQFISFLNKCTADKNERDRLEIQAEKDRLAKDARDEEIRKNAEKTERERIEAQQKADEQRRIDEAAKKKLQAEKDAQKLIDDARIEAERVVQAEKDRIAQKEADEREKEAKRIEQEAKEKYLAWAKEQGWTPETADQFKTNHGSDGIELWKLVGVFKE